MHFHCLLLSWMPHIYFVSNYNYWVYAFILNRLVKNQCSIHIVLHNFGVLILKSVAYNIIFLVYDVFWWYRLLYIMWWNADVKVKCFTHLIITIYIHVLMDFCCDLCFNSYSINWGRDKMAAISQTTFWNAFSWMTVVIFWFKFNWNLFPMVQLLISDQWLRSWLGTGQAARYY